MFGWLLSICLSCVTEMLALDITDKHFNQILSHLSPCFYRHHWFLLFCTTFSDLDLGWGSQSQGKKQTYWLHFLAHFSTEWDKIWCDETIQVEHPEFKWDFFSQGKLMLFCCLFSLPHMTKIIGMCITQKYSFVLLLLTVHREIFIVGIYLRLWTTAIGRAVCFFLAYLK